MIYEKFMKYSTWKTLQICYYQFEVVGKNIRIRTCCLYVLSCSSLLLCWGQEPNLHHLWKISLGKHNGCANSGIGDGMRKVYVNKINWEKHFDRSAVHK